MTSPVLTAALDAQAAGYSVIPLNPRSKVAAIRWKAFQTTAATLERVRAWWAANSAFNLGLVTGAVSRLSVVDYDPRNDPDGGTGRWLDAILPAPTVHTGAGGRHWYIREPGPTVVGLRPGLDVKGDGGYVVAPPSVHPTSGRAYTAGSGGVVDSLLTYWPSELAPLLAATLGQKKDRSSPNSNTPAVAPGDRLTVAEVLPLLEHVARAGTGWLARCPAHDDGRPSLGIREDNRRLLLWCFAKCAFADVLRAIRYRQMLRDGA